MGITNNKLCNFGNVEEEHLIHLFWQCPVIKTCWEKVHRWIVTLTDTQIDFCPTECLLYCSLNAPIPYNLVFNLTRYFIYLLMPSQPEPT